VHRFWSSVLKPLVHAVRPEVVVEIGVLRGDLTRRLLEAAPQFGAVVHGVDPDPQIDAEEWAAAYGDAFRLHREPSLDALPKLGAVDLLLIDGDHNHHTVLGELTAAQRRADDDRRTPPVIVMHDVDWPYGRRDMYYAPDRIPPEARHPYARKGLRPDSTEVADVGINAHLDNALHEGGARNGVRTALDDFLESSPREWTVGYVPGTHGLAIVVADEVLEGNRQLKALLRKLRSADWLVRRAGEIEQERLWGEVARVERAERAAQTIAAVRRELDAAQARQDEVREDVRRAEAELDDARRHAAQLERQAEDERSSWEKDRARIARDLESRVAEIAGARETIAAIQGDLDAARAQEAEARTALRTLRQEQEAAHRRAADLEATMAEHGERADQLQRSRDAALQRTDEAEQALDAERQRAVELGDELDELRARVAQLQRARDDAAEQAERLGGELESARSSEAELQAQTRRAADDAETMRSELDALRGKLEDERASAEEERALLQRALTAERTRREEDEGRIGELEEGLAQARATAERAAERQRRIEADLADVREPLEAELLEARASATDARRRLEALERQTLEDRLAFEELRGSRSRLQAALGDARADLEVARAERDALQAELERLAAEHGRARLELDRRAADLQRMTQSFRLAQGESATAAPVAAVETPPAAQALPAAPADAAAQPGRAVDPVVDDAALRARAREHCLDADSPEIAARLAFLEQYLATVGWSERPTTGSDPLAVPGPTPNRRVLVDLDAQAETDPSIDVVVCVHNALDDVRLCLWSLTSKSDLPFRLILVNDGSDEPTTRYLEAVAAANPEITLIHNAQPPHGYTIAANLGMRAATADYVIVLNSDTVVTFGWLQRIVDAGEDNEQVGILGPLSNAASHQSVPQLRDGGAWSTNPLPVWVTPDGMAAVVSHLSPRRRPRLPFVNGFCYVVKRAVFDAIGYFDEEHFASGYSEENDFSYRAGKAGFELAVVDDAYVYHAKSRSFTPEGRSVHAKRNYQIFLDKHDREEIEEMVRGMEANTALSPLRAAVSDAIGSPTATAAAVVHTGVDPLTVVFVLPGLGDGGSGGSHSIYQEVSGMRRLGIDARIALVEKAFPRAEAIYDDAADVFQTFRDVDDLVEKTRNADVISATHFKSVAMVARVREARDDFLPAYYIQDYEPFFASTDPEDVKEAITSYTAIPGVLLFAKTHWLCNVVSQIHGLPVAKVEPSLDEELYVPRPHGRPGDGPVRVVAMVRPRTPRRQPHGTVRVLERLQAQYPDAVEVMTFGCHDAELAKLTESPVIRARHLGLLRRHRVAGLLGRTDIFLDLSMYQAFGRTALEAMACGATVVAPRLGGVWEFARDGENMLVTDTLDEDAAFEAVVSLVSDRDRLRSFQEQARATASRYSIMRAAFSEYVLFEDEHARRFGRDFRRAGVIR